MRLFLLLNCMFFGSLILQAQDDIYFPPEPVKPRIVYQNSPNKVGNGRYENLDDTYNPDFNYQYRRSLRRMYDPYYVMSSSVFINMYSYPQFANFYDPYLGGNSLIISTGNGWNNPWRWNNGWVGGGWNSWGGGWNTGWSGRDWNNGNRHSVNPPERRISRAVRVMVPNRDYGNTRYRPSQNQYNTNRNPSSNTNTNTPVFRGSQGTSSPSPTVNPSPTRMGNMNSSSNSSGGSGRTGRSSGGSRF